MKFVSLTTLDFFSHSQPFLDPSSETSILCSFVSALEVTVYDGNGTSHGSLRHCNAYVFH